MKWNIKDMTGLSIGRLTVETCAGTDSKGIVRWSCRCACGNIVIVPGYVLRRGASKSCGCIRKEHGAQILYRHGMSRSRVYSIWFGMVRRCTDPKHKDYPRYGGSGITICGTWLKFLPFYADMGDPPTNKHEIDRKENDKGYFKDNCRWATCKENQRNRTSNRLITHNGETKLLVEWAELSPVAYPTFRSRLEMGWAMEKALTAPLQKLKRRAT